MHGSYQKPLFILALLFAMIILPVSAETTRTGDDSKFLTDITDEGIPLLFEIPAVMKTGFFNGAENSISTVGQEQTSALETFLTKINGYTLSDEVKSIRDQFIASAEIYKNDLKEYSILVSTCDSCVSKMNEIYPRLHDEAKKTNKLVIGFYQKTSTPVP